MAKKNKNKKHRLENVALIVSIINGLTTTICLIYETFFKQVLGGGNSHHWYYKPSLEKKL